MRRNSDNAIRDLARRIYEGDTSLIPALARLHERLPLDQDEDPNEVWLVERWNDGRNQATKWVVATYSDATALAARLMLDEIENEIAEMDSTDGWMSADREDAWKRARRVARRAFRRGDLDGWREVIEAFESIGTDLVNFARNGVPFVARPLEDEV